MSLTDEDVQRIADAVAQRLTPPRFEVVASEIDWTVNQYPIMALPDAGVRTVRRSCDCPTEHSEGDWQLNASEAGDD